jgi:hypothetical protein
MMKKKPIPKKPLGRAPQGQPAQPQDEHETPVPSAPAQPEDELALQHIEAPTSYPGENFKRPDKRIKDAPSKSSDFDTSNLLTYAWVGLGIFVVGAVFYFFYSGRTSIDSTGKENVPPPQTTQNSAAKSNTATTTGNSANTAKTVVNVDNPSNRAGYEGIKKFLNWAYDAKNLKGDEMASKMKSDNPLTGVDDPDVIEYQEKLCEFMRLGKDHPLRPPEDNDPKNPNLSVNKGGGSPDSAVRKTIERRYIELANLLKTRYK